MNPYAPPSDTLGTSSNNQISDADKKALASELSRLNALSFAFALPGLILQGGAGAFAGDMLQLRLFQLAGTALFLVGVYFYCRMRGCNPWFLLFGLLSLIGFVVLYFLPKSCLHCKARHGAGAKQCNQCGAPLGA